MKKAFVVLLVVAGLLVATGNVFADTETTNQGTATVKVLTPLVLTHDTTSKLNFGSIGVIGSAGTVTVASTGGVATRTLQGAVGYTDSTNAYALDYFSASSLVTTTTYYIGFTDSVTITNGYNTMTVSDFKAYDSSGNQITTSYGNSAFYFWVGAKLTLSGSESAGTYSGTYPVYLGYLE